jgi:hypothetical protein
MNGPFVLHQAALFASRVAKEAGTDRTAQITRAYRIAFARAPSAGEMQSCLKYMEKHGIQPSKSGTDEALIDLCHALFNFNEFVYVE